MRLALVLALVATRVGMATVFDVLLDTARALDGLLEGAATADGTATTLNGTPVRLREPADLAAATLLVTDTLSVPQHQDAAGWDTLTKRVRLVRTWGDCYGYLLVATGWADIMGDPVMNPWDIAALVPVIRGAGGVITDWQGREPMGAKSTLAAHPKLHAEVLRILNP